MADQLITTTFSDDGTRGAGFTYGWNAIAFNVCGSVAWKKGGCQGSISPSGQYCTHNIDHDAMTIEEFGGATAKTISLAGNINNHKFSRHSNDWVLYTTCTNGQNGCGGGSSEAHLLNWHTGEDIKLGDLMKAWDYHPTATYGPTEPPVATAMTISPSSGMTVEYNSSLQFTAAVVDQFGSQIDPQPAINWSITGSQNDVQSGSVNVGDEKGTFTLTATSDGFEASVQITVVGYLPVDIKVNCGDNSPSVDGWEADNDYTSNGDAYDFGGNPDVSGVDNAAPVDVYKTVRHNNHDYSFDVPDATYRVRIHFIDGALTDGRAMDYTIEGEKVLEGYSIQNDVGQWKAAVKEFTTNVNDGNGLQIGCDKAGGDDVFDAGIEVFRLENGTVARGSSIAIGPGRAQSTLQVLRTGRELAISTNNREACEVRIYTARGKCVYSSRHIGAGSFRYRPEAGGVFMIQAVAGGSRITRQVMVP